MSSPSSSSLESPPSSKGGFKLDRLGMVSAFISLLVVIWFFCFEQRFGFRYSFSALGWLLSCWQPGSELEHGKFLPFVVLGLVAYKRREIRESIGQGSWWGVVAVAVGCLLYVAAYRTVQPRIAIGGLPFILCGMIYALYGWRVTKLVAFPIFLIYAVVPLPSFQQATTHLQLLATKMAYHGSALFGVETYTKGTTILPIEGDWQPLSIAHGCSGIRSLMALLMISTIWAYIAKISLWKKGLLLLSAIPLAIIGNALRVTSIFVIAEYGDAKWASTTWHDWSGLLLFYPFSLFLLFVFHSIVDGGLPWRRREKQVIHRSAGGQETKEVEPS